MLLRAALHRLYMYASVTTDSVIIIHHPHILTYYIQYTGKYHESVARIGTSAASTSTNTGNGRVMFPSTLCVMYYPTGSFVWPAKETRISTRKSGACLTDR